VTKPRLAFLLAALITAAAHAADPMFPRTTRAFELSASYITHIRFSDDVFYNANLAVGYYLFDNFSVSAELQGYYADQPFDDTAIVAGGFLLRYHPLRFGRVTLFVDAGGDISYAEAPVPNFGTHFNFIGKVGAGASLELTRNTHLLAGARYFHLSNANIHGRDQNPSYDGIQYWTGILWTW
jgi:hypothetical protein